MTDRVPGTVRLRSAGFGVVGAGVALGILGLFLPFTSAAALLFVSALVGGFLGRAYGTWFIQLCLGVGTIGIIGLLEAETSVGLGLNSGQLAGAAVVFGLLDIVVGSVLHRYRDRLTD